MYPTSRAEMAWKERTRLLQEINRDTWMLAGGYTGANPPDPRSPRDQIRGYLRRLLHLPPGGSAE